MAARIRRITKEKYLNYLRKSDEFYRSAEEAAWRGDWTAAVSNAVHSGISAADALTTFYAGERSAAQDHDDVLRLLATLGINRDEIDRSMKHLNSLLEVKNLAEYEDRLPRQGEAESALRNADRFRRWVLAKLPARTHDARP